MDINEVKNKIKSRGYWEINITPSFFNNAAIPDRATCKELVNNSSVKLRGWDYPHIPRQDNDHQKMYLGADYCESFTDFGTNKEVFRFYQSGQFIHYLSLWEDWVEEDYWRHFASTRLQNIKPGSILNIISVIYSVTEIFEFLRRLTENSSVYDTGVIIDIKFFGAKDRQLEILDPMRGSLWGEYKAHENIISVKKELTKEKILSDAHQSALEVVKYIFETFGWENQPTETFQKDQKNLLDRKF